MKKTNIDIAQIEHFLAQQGSFCLIDWLLKENYLSYSHYEAWRYGKEVLLDHNLSIDDKEINKIIKETKNACKQLNLSSQQQDYYTWSSSKNNKLTISRQQTINTELGMQWLRPQDLPQLDLFMDNTEVITENRILDALGGRQFESAQKALSQLTELNPNQKKLGEYQDLINYGLYISNNPTIEKTTLSQELAGLENEVSPLAHTILKHNARDYLAFAWRRLSNSLENQTFNQQQPKLNQSYMLMQIPDWQGVLSSLADDKQLFTTAILLHRLALAYEATKCDNEALLIWCLLMEMDRVYCERIIEEQPTPLINPLWQDFWETDDEEYDGEYLGFFPAFIFTKIPGLIHHLGNFPTLQQPATLAVIEAIKIRQQQGDEVPIRKKMQDISPALLKLFINR